MEHSEKQAAEVKAAIAGLEAQRSVLGDAVVEPALAALRQQLQQLEGSAVERATEEERKIVTIVFADVSGFTAMSEKMDPEEVRGVMNACFESLVPVVRKYEGTIDKFIGDEIMALFGAPVAHENDAERALRAALEMMQAIASFNREHATELGLHIGINTGPVIAGQIGAQARRDYSVMGDAVNLAARLEDASSSGEIFVGPNTHRLTAQLFDFEKIPPLNLKGKAAPVEVYRLVGTKAEPGSVRGIEGLQAPMVGRDREFEEIRSALAELRTGHGAIVAVEGEAGLGKSRLIVEALQSFAEGMASAEGRALSHTAGMSYWMARDLLFNLLKVKAETAPAEIEAALENSVAEVLPEKAADVYPFLARLLEIPLENAMEERVKFLTSEALHGRILQAFRDYVRARATQGPLILFWEDLHWCDPSSLRVLETILPLTSEVALVLLLAYRPDEELVQQMQEQARSACAQGYRRIELSPLTREQSGSLIEGLLKIDNLPDLTRDLMLNRAEGNPFFLEELLRSLLDAGTVIVQNGRVIETRPIQSVEVPETLQGVLMARIDRLTPERKQTLQNAAVIGRVFQQKVLSCLYAEEAKVKQQLDDSLAELQRREFIQSREQKTAEASALQKDEYIFKHAITHDVGYGSMLLARRKELHKRVGEALERLFPDRLDELSATLGYHFQRAETREKAVGYLRQAAERAQATFANTEAIAFYRSALEQADLLLSAGADKKWEQVAAQIRENMGDIELLLGEQEKARSAYQGALRRVPPDDVLWSSRLHRKTAKAWIVSREHEKGEQAYQEAEVVLQSRVSSATEWEQEWLQLQLDRMWLHYWRGEVAAIAALAERIGPLVEAHATPLQRGNFFQGLTLMALRRDRYTAGEETLANAQVSLAAIEESQVIPEISHARFVLGFSYLWAGQFDSAEKWIGDALKLTEKTGDIVLQSRCLTYLTIIQRRRGEVDAVRRYAEQSLGCAAAARMVEYIGMAKGNFAWLHLRQGDIARAYEEGRDGMEKLSQTPQGHILLWVALWPLIGVAIAREQIGEAINYVEKLLVPPQMAIPAALETELRAASEAWKAEDHAATRRCLEKVTDLARNIGYL